MSFPGMSVVHGSPQTIWMPVKPATTIYVGGFVTQDRTSRDDGVIMLPDAAGVANVTNHDQPFGICIGTNRKNPLYSATYLTEYITAPAAGDAFGGASIEYVGVEGPWSKGDPIPMVKVALVDANTVIRAPLRNAAIGTAPSVLTDTVGQASGLGFTAVADAATIAFMSTAYCRSGANEGAYRLIKSAGSTTHTWTKATRSACAIGDTWVTVPVPTFGPGTVMFDATTSMFIDVADAPVANGTARWSIFVYRLDLRVAGQEYCEFRFDPSHFGSYVTTA